MDPNKSIELFLIWVIARHHQMDEYSIENRNEPAFSSNLEDASVRLLVMMIRHEPLSRKRS